MCSRILFSSPRKERRGFEVQGGGRGWGKGLEVNVRKLGWKRGLLELREHS